MLKLRDKLGFRLTMVLIIIIVMIIGVSRYFDFLEEKEILLEHIDEQGNLLAHAIAISILEPILLEDVPVVETYINQLKLQNANIYSIKVWRKDKTLLASSESNENSSDLHSYSKEIIIAEINEVVGHVDVSISSSLALQIIKNRAVDASLLWLLVTIVLIILIYGLLKQQVIKPVKKLGSQANDLRKGYMDVPVVLPGNNEFSLLAKTLDDMRVGLVKYRTISESQKEELEISNKDLQEALEEAKNAVQAKTDFLANMSHEIRTPMNGILGVVQLLTDTEMSKEQKGYLKTLEYSSNSLLTIINDILDFSKIESGMLEIEEININLNNELKEIEKLLLPLAEKKSLQLKFNYFDEDVFTFCDPVRLSQILLNLTCNAIKFTEQGKVDINTTIVTEDNEQITIKFEVTDTGIGIPEQKLAHIFEKFTQADSSTTRKFGGTGLGLPISNKLVELMGSKLSVKSTPGKGSTFSFILSLKRGEDLQEELLQQEGKRINISAKVLLAEDNATNRLIANRTLEKIGIQVINAENGIQAVELFEKYDFDLVLMDMQMPLMSGVDATIKIRQLFQDKQVPIIAMTANAMPEHKEQCLSAGMNDYITKPVNVKLLEQILVKYLHSETNRSD